MEEKAKKIIYTRGLEMKAKGEKPTQYFLNLEKNNNAQKFIPRLRINKDGIESCIENQKDIEEEIKNYYKNLYSCKDNYIDITSIEDFLDGEHLNHIIPKLSPHESINLEGKVTESEVLKILKKTSNNSAPGLSGFSFAFYKVFWNSLRYFILNAMNYSFDVRKLPKSQSRGIISIIPKGNKPKEFLDNWRPLTMLCCWYKLLSGVIAARINNILSKIIHTDQSGFVPNRFIGDCIRNTFDIMSSAKNNNKTGLLLLVDFRKAFDSISFNFIEKSLTFFNLLLRGFSAQTIHAGNISDAFEVLVGCRQGDPLAAPLFLLAIEILCIKLRTCPNLDWFSVENINVLLSLYADDVSIFLDYTDRNLRATIEILERFFRLSGLQIQKKKTQAVVFGSVPQGNIRLCPDISLRWDQDFELLGIKFDAMLEKMDRNIKEKLLEMDNIINNWKHRFLSPIGRCVVAKTLLLSKLSHIAFSVPILEKKKLQMIENKIYNFIWNGGDKVARNDAKKGYKDGGLNFPDVFVSFTAFKLSWIRRIQNGSSTWARIFQASLSRHFPNLKTEDILSSVGTLTLKNICKKISNPFWNEVLSQLYTTIPLYIKCNPCHLLTTPIWDSLIFLRNKKVCCRRDFPSLYKVFNYPIEILKQGTLGRLEFLTHDELENKGGYVDRFEYISIKHVFTITVAQYRLNLMIPLPIYPFLPTGVKLANLNYKGCNNWVALLKKKNANNNSIVEREQKWEASLGVAQGVTFWDRCYKNVENIYFDNRLRLFYYNIVRGILKTNRIISKHKPEVSVNCTFCDRYRETILHLFHDCHIVNNFITNVQHQISVEMPLIRPINNKKHFIFGRPDENIYSINNLFCLYLKYYIWKSRCNKSPLNYLQFKKWLYHEWKLNIAAFRLDKRISELRDAAILPD